MGLSTDNLEEPKSAPRVPSGQVNTLSYHGAYENLSFSALDPSATPAPKTKEEAVLTTIRSLEGLRSSVQVEKKQHQRDILANIKRPAPEPPHPRSLDLTVDAEKNTKGKKMDQMRSLGLNQVARVEVTAEAIQIDATLPDGGAGERDIGDMSFH